jgi:hypothetical protein
MATEADWTQLQNAYGLQQSDVTSLKNAGYSADQASQLLQLSIGGGDTVRQGGNLGGGQGSVGGSPTIGGSGLTPQMLTQMAQLFGRPGGQQQQAPVNRPAPVQPDFPGSQPTWAAGQPTTNQQTAAQPGQQPAAQQPAGQPGQFGVPVSGGSTQQTPGPRNYPSIGIDPNQPMTNLGAAALGQVAIYNPQPGAGTGGDTGVTGSGGAGFAGGGGLTIGGVSTQPTTPTTSGVVPRAPRGPWTTTPGLFAKAPTLSPTAPLPVTPTQQATGVPYTPGQAWAIPPSAPGVNVQGIGTPMPMGGGMPPAAPGLMMPTTPTPGLTMHPNGFAQEPGQLTPGSGTWPTGGGQNAAVAGAATALGNKPK